MSYKLSANSFRGNTLFPVILPVPPEVQDFKPREQVVFLSRHARRALMLSAEKSGVEFDEPVKDDNGVPQPFKDIHWSISHKTRYVCGIAAPAPIGIDIERARDLSVGLFKKTAVESEWALADMETGSVKTFFRFWTAKEAVLKATGIGIRDLLKCRVHQILDDHHLEIKYDGRDWLIEHFFFEDHVAAIVKSSFQIEWKLERLSE
ncbi:MAG: 4'-phosphopantetheinyl transferase superfamily protein [bacterium]|nr:4'-phosphopantetheinyl transferase superfamily protein [bacterium]